MGTGLIWMRFGERGYIGDSGSLEGPVGEIVVDIALENVHDRGQAEGGSRSESEVRRETIKAVADTTGAVMLALPQDVVRRLGLSFVSTIATMYADGRRGNLPVAGPLTIEIGDRSMPTNCIVVPEGADALIGQVVMEVLDLIPDPMNQTLGPRPESPDRPLLRV